MDRLPITKWLWRTKGTPDGARLDRRSFLRISSGVIGAGIAIPLVGCGEEQTKCDSAASSTVTETATETETEVGPLSGEACEVAFPRGYLCDSESEAGGKHTPVISSFDDAELSYKFDVEVPHVVTPGHHILGCQVVSYIPGALSPHVWVDFHYYTNEYIRSADDASWQHQFDIPKESIHEQSTHLMIFSVCNKHGQYGGAFAL